MTNNNSIVADVVSIPLAGVSTIACIIALGVLLYYKMWRTFIYRLVFYMFLSLIVSSLTTFVIAILDFSIITDRGVSLAKVNFTNETGLFVAKVFLIVTVNSSQAIAFLLVTCINACITLMALRSYQFTYRSDLCLLISSIVYVMIGVIATIVVYVYVAKRTYDEHTGVTILASLFSVAFLVNFVFAALTVVTLCCNLCTRALREILPLFILIVPFSLFIWLYLVSLIKIREFVYNVVTFSIPGLVCAVSFALHLCFVRNRLRRPRGRNNWRPYGSVRQLHTNCSTEFTAEGLSESCNTEHIVVSESENDNRILLQRSND